MAQTTQTQKSEELPGDSFAKKWCKAASGSIYTFVDQILDKDLFDLVTGAKEKIEKDGLVFNKGKSGSTIFKQTKSDFEERQKKQGTFKSKPPIKFVEYIFSRIELLKFINDNPNYEYVGTQAYKGKIGTEFVTIMGTRTIPPMPDLNKNDHGNESLASIKGHPQDQEEAYDEVVGDDE